MIKSSMFCLLLCCFMQPVSAKIYIPTIEEMIPKSNLVVVGRFVGPVDKNADGLSAAYKAQLLVEYAFDGETFVDVSHRTHSLNVVEVKWFVQDIGCGWGPRLEEDRRALFLFDIDDSFTNKLIIRKGTTSNTDLRIFFRNQVKSYGDTLPATYSHGYQLFMRDEATSQIDLENLKSDLEKSDPDHLLEWSITRGLVAFSFVLILFIWLRRRSATP